MASSSWVATASSVPIDRKKVIGELTRGREVADRLRVMLRESGVDATPAAVLPTQELVGKILDSFTQSISILCGGGDSDEVSQVPAVTNSPGRKSEDSGESCKPAPKDRRGCYKRRKTSETVIKNTSTLFEDGHAWRKYGQKVILNTKHPRNYFRCTHKFDQGCQATKQVQKIQDDPPLFRTTYHGQHTCKNLIKAPHQIIVDTETQDSSIVWSFASRVPVYKPNNNVGINSGTAVNAAIKQENRELENEQMKMKSSQPSDGDYFISPEITAFDNGNDHLGAFSSGSDRGDVLSPDVYSCTASTRSMDMDMIVGSVFDDFLEFESKLI